MDFPLYHDPTIINVHTLLKQQPYQQYTQQHYTPSSITHNSSSHTSLTPFFYQQPTSINSLIRYIDSATQQLNRSHRVCIQAISDLASDISTINNNLPPFIYHKPLSNSPNLQTHYGFQQPHLSTQDHPSQFHQPRTYSHSTTTIHSPWVSYTPFTQLPPIYNSNVHRSSASQDLLHRTNHPPIHTEHELVVDGNNSFPLTDSDSRVTMEEKKLVNNDDVDIVTEPTQFDVESIFTVSKIDERSRDDVVTVKGQENHRDVPPSISQSPCDSDGVESVTIQSIVDVPIGLVPTKHRSIFPTRPLLLPYRCTVLTSNDDNTLSRVTKRQVLNHKLQVTNFESSFDFPVVCTFNFDHGGDKSSTVANYGGNCIFSMLSVPWDRGKIENYSFLFPVRGATLGATSGLPWVPWLSRVLISLVWLPWDRGRKAWALEDEFGLMKLLFAMGHHTLDYLHFIMGSGC